MTRSTLRASARAKLNFPAPAPARYGTAFHLQPPYADVRDLPVEKFSADTTSLEELLNTDEVEALAAFIRDDVYGSWQMAHADNLPSNVFRVPAGTTQTLTLGATNWSSQLYIVVVEAGATLTMLDCMERVLLGIRRMLVLQAQESHFSFWGMRSNVSFGTEKMTVRLRGSGATVNVVHLGLGRGQQQLDLNVTAVHEASDTQSTITARLASADQAVAIYRGLISVTSNAPRTHGYQQGRALLLSPRAVVDVLPELKIATNDVRCSHGVTTTHLDGAALFYLRSRGLDPTAAATLALTGFFHQDLAIPPTVADALQRSLREISL